MTTVFAHVGYTVRQWTHEDRNSAAQVIKQCLEAYGLEFEPKGEDIDAIEVEDHYWKNERGEFWVVIEDATQKLVGTGAYFELLGESGREDKEHLPPVEIRKMYLLPEARGKKLGRLMLEELEKRIFARGYTKIYVQTASVLFEACQLYKSAGYIPVTGVDAVRCDQKLYKDVNIKPNNT